MTDQKHNLHFLDGLRGLAALYVVIGHARWLLWEGFAGFREHPQSYSTLQKGLVYFFSLFRYGHESVLFFFVLSGFVIHLRYARQLQVEGSAATFDWSGFVWRRARRLYPPLLASLALAWILYLVGRALNFTIYGAATVYPVINENVVCSVSVQTLLGNMAFLMNTYVPVFGGNGPLWSLKFEWWFYMMYPLFWWVSRKSISAATVLMAALFILAHTFRWPVLLLEDVFGAMLTWWLGVLLADVYVGRLKIQWPIVMVISLLGVILTHFFKETHDLQMAFLFSGVFAVGFLLQERKVRLFWLEWLKPLGDMSYTLYVTHFPIIVLLSGWLISRSAEGKLPPHLGWVFVGVLLAMLAACLIYRLVERPFLNRRA